MNGDQYLIQNLLYFLSALYISISNTNTLSFNLMLGRALFGLQALSSSGGIFEESAIGKIDDNQ